GVILWEMLTGSRLFNGETIAHTLADVLRATVDVRHVPRGTPVAITDLLGRCLERDVKRRLRGIGEARLVLDGVLSGRLGAGRGSLDQRPAATWPRYLPWALTVFALAITGALLLMLAPWRKTPASAEVQLVAELGADASLVTGQGAAAVLSPDGQTLVFVARKAGAAAGDLYIRRLDQLQATPLAGTHGAQNPFFSPDGEWIAVFADAKL